MAKKLFEELQKTLDEPVIVIFASAKIGLWKDEVDLSHVAATHFYLNHKHHSMKKIRKRLQDPIFSQEITTGIKQKQIKQLDIAQIKQLQPQSMELEVISHVVIKYVDDKAAWFFRLCTNCKNEVVHETRNYICKLCKRIIPHPEKRFRVSIVAADSTGGMEF
ncbi:uncharacterized protein LOC141698111 [Apium graveolens]|uniref:uncharacterized protein LOC141698111 n=1 Tax=Apium graveolens TaxID=4045 RepID=UPI003D78C544